jgi:hypothetical protein
VAVSWLSGPLLLENEAEVVVVMVGVGKHTARRKIAMTSAWRVGKSIASVAARKRTFRGES